MRNIFWMAAINEQKRLLRGVLQNPTTASGAGGHSHYALRSMLFAAEIVLKRLSPLARVAGLLEGRSRECRSSGKKWNESQGACVIADRINSKTKCDLLRGRIRIAQRIQAAKHVLLVGTQALHELGIVQRRLLRRRAHVAQHP
jgi:hypothetical protein